MLTVEGLQAGYGKSSVLHGVSFTVGEGEVLALLGRNGMGKSTTLNAVMGIVQPTGGIVRISGRAVSGCRPAEIARRGVGYVPEGRRVFPNLSVRENLEAVARIPPGDVDDARVWTVERITDLFPGLKPRIAAAGALLSGGEQQMLAIGRALMTNPRLLILDEATEGLAPLIRHAIWDALERLRAEGMTILVVDKNLDNLLPLADRCIVLERGEVAWCGERQAAAAERARIEELISVH